MKPLLTEKTRKKRVALARKFKDWIPEQWGKVMFSDERTFRTLRVVQRKVRRSFGSYRYSSRYTIKTMKHPDSVMVWACFTGDVGRGGLYFLPKNCTIEGGALQGSPGTPSAPLHDDGWSTLPHL
jgi:hypothetical protein